MGLLQNRNQDDDDDAGIEIVGMEPLEGGGGEPHDEDVVFDLEDWSDADLTVLRERLDEVGVPHSWEDGALVVRPQDEAWIERLMDQVEQQVSLMLDDTAEQIAYDLSEWDEYARTALIDAIVEDAIPHGWDGSELFVHEIDEQRVDELVESVIDPAAAVASDGGHELMSDLFVASDRLRHDPREREGTTALLAAAERAAASPPPYGVDAAAWTAIKGKAGDLAALVGDESSDDDRLVEAADGLRSILRSYV